MAKRTHAEIIAANKSGQKAAEVTRAAVINAALTVRDTAAPVVERGTFEVKRAYNFVGGFVRTLVGK